MAANASSVFPIGRTRLLKDNPEMTMKDVDTFVKLNKAPQSGIVKGYKFFCEGFIKDFEVGKREEDETVFIRARRFKSFRKNEEPHYLQMSFYNEEVVDHSCSCKAGQGICNHKVALMMYQAAHYSFLKIDAVPEVPSKTSMPQEWHKPRSAGIHPEAVDNLIVRKPELKSEGGPKCKKRAIGGVESNLYNPMPNYPNPEFIREFLARAKTDYKETQFCT
ncbi:hypothetical protein AWC38_SpisGene7791 [Stylophora pistillata]|uniref:SWIM-type domain-containing protein n=1 Tax=Stylophora pistillata TaxID=50429 RepID=A0A2B4SGD9_STYPI|nr:hypothetical protein AWC38_SpisGene7791 [Stylophora pistillata]